MVARMTSSEMSVGFADRSTMFPISYLSSVYKAPIGVFSCHVGRPLTLHAVVEPIIYRV